MRTARRVNEYAADLVLFALIPVPNTEASLREIEYAYSILKADGVAWVTSYGDKWLGHSDYEPVFEELDRRK
ncbi:MAG: amidohydrolase, partial [Acidobacteria bacterium]|nr:amidohydrolase [Acidobacteriota bacterium]